MNSSQIKTVMVSTWKYEDCPYGDCCKEYEPDFAEPSGQSALRRATKSNPRILPCPTCGEPNRLTARDKDLGYQCDKCANIAEGGGF